MPSTAIHRPAHGYPTSLTSSRVSKGKDHSVPFSDSFLGSEQSTLHTEVSHSMTASLQPLPPYMWHSTWYRHSSGTGTRASQESDTEHVYPCSRSLIQAPFCYPLVFFPQSLEAWLGCLPQCQQTTLSLTQLRRWSPGDVKCLLFPPFYLKTWL